MHCLLQHDLLLGAQGKIIPIRGTVPIFASTKTGLSPFGRLLLALAAFALVSGAAWAVESVWVYPGYTGRLIYRPDASGDRISDYSIVGYKQGKTPIPTDVPTVVTLIDDGTSDDTARIQAAINQVAAMPVQANGYRGAVLLRSGSYDVSGQIVINASGVVLRGEGRDDTGTIVHARGTSQRALISITGSGSRSLTGSTYNLIDKVVPAGANSFRVDSTAGLNVGDSIYLTRPSTAEWIHDIGMDQLLYDPTADPPIDYRWTPGSKNQNWERTITRIEGNRVFIDTPVTNALEQKYGGGSFRKFTYSGRIQNVGVENMRGESDYASDTDEAHSWDFVTVDKAQDVWVRGTKARYFAYSLVSFDRDAKWCTAIDNISEMPKSVITGGRRYTYNIEGQQNLVMNCQATDGRHDFVLGSTVAGPNVFYNSTASNVHADAGPHHRYSTGTLFDNITTNGEINVQNRWNSGTGHGWAGANDVIWNSTAAGYTVQEIITIDNATIAKNWIIGSIGAMRGPDFAMPSGVVFPTIPLANDARYSPKYDDSHGVKVATTSLYQKQLAEAGTVTRDYQWLGGSGRWADILKWDKSAVPAVRMVQTRDYLIGDIDGLTYDANADDDYYIDPAFRARVESQFGSNIGGFDVAAGNRNTTFTQQFDIASTDQIVNAYFALAIRPTGGTWSNDVILIDGVGIYSLNTLNWTRAVGQTSVGVFDMGPYMSVLQNGKLSVALSDDTAADFGLLSLQVFGETADAQGANATLSGGGVATVDVPVPNVGKITISGAGTTLEIANGGQLVVKDVVSQGAQGAIVVTGGMVQVTGTMDNSTRVYINGGTFRAGSSAALGTTNALGTSIAGGTLDINGINLQTEPITVQGAGVGGNGAIINSSTQQISALTSVTLAGDATFGGSASPPGGSGFGRWDIRGTGATLSTTGQAYNLTKVGLNQVSFVATAVDSALANININQGILAFQTSTSSMGDASKTVTIASGGILNFYNTTNAMNKKCVLDGGTIWAESGTGATQNTFSGPITLLSGGGVFDAGGSLAGGTNSHPDAVLHITGPITGVGGLSKTGPSTVFITGVPSYTGATNIGAGTLQINSHAVVVLQAITGAGTLGVDNTTSLAAASIMVNTLIVGAGSTVTIAPLPDGPLDGIAPLLPVPEPSTWAMLAVAALATGVFKVLPTLRVRKTA